jgi:allophanate hydrolase subunit 1
VEYDSLVISQSDLLKRLIDLEETLGSALRPIPSRVFRFPLLLDDPLAKQAIADYMAKARDSAVYLPDNVEYIAMANGVEDVEFAKRSIMSCRQLVTELSFLAGTPLMLPLDPRLVYVAQKYNPVRPFTAEGTVGLGGPLSVSECSSHSTRLV